MSTVLYILVAFVLYYILIKVAGKKGPQADYQSFSKYVKFRLNGGKSVTKEDVDNVEQFSLALGVPFTAREQASYLANTTPKKVQKLRAKANKAKALWNKLSVLGKYLAYAAAVVTFGILYSNWAGPLWDMLVTSAEFVWGVLKSLPLSVLAAIPFAIFVYVAKKLADYRRGLHNRKAATVEKTIPEINSINAILNQQ